ncbi:MAG: hypothetical protein H7178_06755 [Chitinophagaceae bacterium]|nr:hypothetical protein [Chitinophagaceae bacterium]
MFKLFTRDNLKLGLVLGFIAPFLGIYGYYLLKIKTSDSTFWEFLRFLLNKQYGQSLLTSTLTFSLMANALIFTIYANTDKYKTAKGIFILSLIFAIPLIILKVFY